MDCAGNCYYRRLPPAIDQMASSIRKDVATKGIVLVIIDSVGMAGGDEPEKAATTVFLSTAFALFFIPLMVAMFF